MLRLAVGIGAAPGIAALDRPGRSAALGAEAVALVPVDQAARLGEDRRLAEADLRRDRAHVDVFHRLAMQVGGVRGRVAVEHRSEEHTSELQSLMRISYAVLCLKKKKQK